MLPGRIKNETSVAENNHGINIKNWETGGSMREFCFGHVQCVDG